MELSKMNQVPEEIRGVVANRLGDDGLEILEQLAELGSATDTELSELLDKRTSQIRKALYGMYEHRVADYEEHRDPSNGWLTFVWEYTPEQARRALEDAKRKAAEELRDEISYVEANDFYACHADHVRMPFEDAMDFQFACPDCGEQLEHEDKETIIQELQTQLQGLEGATA